MQATSAAKDTHQGSWAGEIPSPQRPQAKRAARHKLFRAAVNASPKAINAQIEVAMPILRRRKITILTIPEIVFFPRI
jgi:hypothetical protein